MANVSHVVPGSHPSFNIVPRGAERTATHSREFLAFANSARGYRQALNAGIGMALAAIRLLTDRKALQEVKQAFRTMVQS